MDANINIISIWDTRKQKTSFLGKILSHSKPKAKRIATPYLISEKCKGVSLGNSTIKSLIFSTDMALIENDDADAVLAVYPFSPSSKIMKSLIDFSEKPVICGVGGGLTQGKVSLEMALAAEAMGAAAIIVNQPFQNKHIEVIKRKINLPIISSVSIKEFSFRDRVNAGVDIFHVAGGSNTASIIDHINFAAPGFPIIATCGKTLDNLQKSIIAGADAIVLTPPNSSELFKPIMEEYRKGIGFCKGILE